jgi:hypothetical protein
MSKKNSGLPRHVDDPGSVFEEGEQDVAGLLHAEVVGADGFLGL